MVCAALVLIVHAAGPMAGVADERDERDAIKAFYRAWSEAAQRGADGYVASFAENARLLPPDQPPAIGRAQIREWFERATKDPASRLVPESIEQDDPEVSGNVAVVRTVIRGRRGAEGTKIEATYLDVLRRSDRGQWAFAYRIWNQRRIPG